MPKLEPYHSKSLYSYALGVFPALKLIESRPEAARRLLLHSGGLQNEGVAMLRERCAAQNIREEFADRVLRRESKKDNCYAAVVFDKYEDALHADAPHVVLCQISDAGNLGSALRSMLGFGIRDVAVIRPAADVFDPHAIRASMGALFGLRLRVYGAFDEYRAQYPAHSAYPFMLKGAKPLPEAAASRPERYALIFGNEQTGLPESFGDVGQSVFIPQSPEIDSLNLAAAVAVGVYAFTHIS